MGIAEHITSPEYWLLHVLSPLVVAILATRISRQRSRQSGKRLEYVLIANAAALPILIVTGYSALVGHWFFDLTFCVGIAFLYFAAAKVPSASLRAFAFLMPNAIAAALYLSAVRLGVDNAELGVLAIYPLVFIALSPGVFVWLAALARESRHAVA